jgi:hypothetical protein
MAASAAFALAVHGEKVYSSRDAILGSMGSVVVHQYYKHPDVETTIIRSPAKKFMGSSYEPLSEETKKEMQEDIDRTTKFYLQNISRRRNISVDKLMSYNGSDITPEEALKDGLIDGIMTFDELLNKIIKGHREMDILSALNVTEETAQARVQQLLTLEKSATSLMALAGVNSLEQVASSLLSYKTSAEQTVELKERLNAAVAKNNALAIEGLITANKAKMTAGVTAHISTLQELASAAGKDPVVMVKSYLDNCPDMIDLKHYSQKEGGENSTPDMIKNPKLTEEQIQYYNKALKNVMSIEEFQGSLVGKETV